MLAPRRTAVLAVLAAGLWPVAAQEPAPPPPDIAAIEDPAIATMTALLVVERTLLAEALERHHALALERPGALSRLAQLRTELDAELAKDAEANPERLDELAAVVGQAGADLDQRLAVELESVRRIAGHVRRVALLERQLDVLEGGRAAEETGVLSGTWDLVLLPLDQKGSCVLEQSGAVVTGTYRLQGGFSGSLQGTLVNRKVYLVRIDSRLGKIMELEGFASADGRTISGTWLNYELAGAAGSTGHWAATRRAPAR